MQTSIATACVSGSLSDNLRAVAEVDPDDAKLFEHDIRSFDGAPEDVRALGEGLTPDRRGERAAPGCWSTTISSGRHALKGGG
jgi:hypothetical protein